VGVALPVAEEEEDQQDQRLHAQSKLKSSRGSSAARSRQVPTAHPLFVTIASLRSGNEPRRPSRPRRYAGSLS